jgi:two-component system, OmpR family, phosphate regulon sensor histidine kinase PhoR
MKNPQWISALLAILVSAVVFGALNFSKASQFTLFIGSIISFISTGIFSFILLDMFVFTEINNIKVMLKDLKLKRLYNKKQLDAQRNPFKFIKQEVEDFAMTKETEIANLRNMEKYRMEFLGNVSHELKTPIFSAQGYIHTLLDGALNDLTVNENFLKKAAKNLDQLEILVNDLLTLNQIEIGAIKLHFEVVELQELISDILEDHHAKIQEAAITMVVDIPDKLTVLADRKRIRQVLNNLIENAIKYGGDAVTIQVKAQKTTNLVSIAVSDTGPGIAKEDISRVFERFYRVEKSRSREKGGSGLGLAIVKHILALHGFRIKVSSKPYEHTEFSFKLKAA